MLFNLPINLSLRLDKFFLSKKHKNNVKIEIISLLDQACDSLEQILEFEGYPEKMAVIIEDCYIQARESYRKAENLIRVNMSPKHSQELNIVHRELSFIKSLVNQAKNMNLDPNYIQESISDWVGSIHDFINAKENYVIEYLS
ncbi:hypothetical protein IB633_08645 [Francisella philomiragia]|uniref:Uncharacterized protein n=1 Tax=Francisella philomiragia subsp. philomiragia (strain ATCC 25017 / CCUG 19701 / FSC 153 / O\|nr:hypothetical protein [Francisella philomiragia]AJI46442.1 hypothetical protein BF30_155 [Francisella philomiragia]AJI48712.1 hypothetical protein KU46_1397 [Francisella philomiragia]MBK2021328.1 hypothetical protein [Francisella philomiragia]MBK2031121.1 hypothetical protein [Francisella philomiragia]MBK2264173.1 hypothetical protein [Francisella philomiragia]